VPELANNYYHATPHGWVLLVAPGPSPCTRLWDPRSGHGARAARGLRVLSIRRAHRAIVHRARAGHKEAQVPVLPRRRQPLVGA
jgi:hypothetical protein